MENGVHNDRHDYSDGKCQYKGTFMLENKPEFYYSCGKKNCYVNKAENIWYGSKRTEYTVAHTVKSEYTAVEDTNDTKNDVEKRKALDYTSCLFFQDIGNEDERQCNSTAYREAHG